PRASAGHHQDSAQLWRAVAGRGRPHQHRWAVGREAMRRLRSVLALACLLLASGAARGADVPEPHGFRTAEYRAPTPATLQGARLLTTADAKQLWESHDAVFVDVMPHAPRPANLPVGTIWRERPRSNIPGSIWLPDTGYGELAAVTERYLRDNLARATAGNRARLLVIYCLNDCWM